MELTAAWCLQAGFSDCTRQIFTQTKHMVGKGAFKRVYVCSSALECMLLLAGTIETLLSLAQVESHRFPHWKDCRME